MSLSKRAPMRATTDGCPSFLPLLLASYSNSRRRLISHRHENDIHRVFWNVCISLCRRTVRDCKHEGYTCACTHTDDTKPHTNTHAWCSLTLCGPALRLHRDALSTSVPVVQHQTTSYRQFQDLSRNTLLSGRGRTKDRHRQLGSKN